MTGAAVCFIIMSQCKKKSLSNTTTKTITFRIYSAPSAAKTPSLSGDAVLQLGLMNSNKFAGQKITKFALLNFYKQHLTYLTENAFSSPILLILFLNTVPTILTKHVTPEHESHQPERIAFSRKSTQPTLPGRPATYVFTLR